MENNEQAEQRQIKNDIPQPVPSAFTIGRAFSLTFSMCAKNPVFYSFLAALSSLPAVIGAVNSVSNVPDFWLIYTGNFIQHLCVGVISFGVCKNLAGEHATQRESLRRALDNGLSLLGVSFILVIMTSLGTAFDALQPWFAEPVNILVYLFFIFADLFAVILSLYCFFVLVVIVPACVIEHLTPRESLKRSRALTKGHYGTIFWFGVVDVGAYLILYFAIDGIFPAKFNVTGANIVWTALSPIINAVILVISPCIYHLLRIDEKRLDIQAPNPAS